MIEIEEARRAEESPTMPLAAADFSGFEGDLVDHNGLLMAFPVGEADTA